MTRTLADGLSIEFGPAAPTDESRLVLEAGSLRWVGPLAADDPEAATRRFRLEVREDVPDGTNVLDWLAATVARIPLPPHGMQRLAERLLALDPERALAWVDGREPVDGALARALAERRPSDPGGARVRLRREPRFTITEPGRTWMDAARRADGSLLGVSFARGPGYALHLVIDGRPLQLDVPPELGVVRLLPALGYASHRIPRAGEDVEPVAYEADSKICTVFPDVRVGTLDRAMRFPIANVPIHAFRFEERIVVQAQGEIVVVSEDAARRGDVDAIHRIPLLPIRTMASEHPSVFGRFVTGVSNGSSASTEVKTLTWFDLRGERPPEPTSAPPSGEMIAYDGLLYQATGQALHRLVPGRPSHDVVATGAFRTPSVNEHAIWVSEVHAGLHRAVRLSPDGKRLAEAELPHYPTALLPAGEGVVSLSSLSFQHVHGDGRLGVFSGDRRASTAARLAGGGLVACAGEELLFVGADGTALRRRTMPYDGTLAGALGEGVLFVPSSYGFARTTPDGLHLLGADGRTLAVAPIDDSVLRTEHRYDEGRLLLGARFDPRAAVLLGAREVSALLAEPAAPDESSPEAPRLAWALPPRVGESRILPPIVNPRDDWPEAGVEVDGRAVLLRGGTYAGTPGVAPAVHARHGAVVVLDGCTLPDGGVAVDDDACVILLGSRVGTAQKDRIGRGGRIFRFDTQV